MIKLYLYRSGLEEVRLEEVLRLYDVGEFAEKFKRLEVSIAKTIARCVDHVRSLHFNLQLSIANLYVVILSLYSRLLDHEFRCIYIPHQRGFERSWL
jgi:Txe/YoeB family toxin of Txe-Axe toxin-antitoxin module